MGCRLIGIVPCSDAFGVDLLIEEYQHARSQSGTAAVAPTESSPVDEPEPVAVFEEQVSMGNPQSRQSPGLLLDLPDELDDDSYGRYGGPSARHDDPGREAPLSPHALASQRSGVSALPLPAGDVRYEANPTTLGDSEGDDFDEGPPADRAAQARSPGAPGPARVNELQQQIRQLTAINTQLRAGVRDMERVVSALHGKPGGKK